MEEILKKFFLNFNNADIQFTEKELTWRFYIIKKTLLTIKRIVLIKKKKFAKVMLNENVRAFIVYVALVISKITIYLAYEV